MNTNLSSLKTFSTSSFIRWSLALIKSLFFSSSPAAILFAIISIIVYAFNRSGGMFFTVINIILIHVFVKFFKGLPQTFYATTTPIFIAFNIWISASSAYGTIHSIKLGMSKTVLQVRRIFSTNTPARFCTASYKRLKLTLPFFPTTTYTQNDSGACFSFTSYFNYSKSPIFLTNTFYCFHIDKYTTRLMYKLS